MTLESFLLALSERTAAVIGLNLQRLQWTAMATQKNKKKVSSQGIKTPRKTSQTSSAAKPTSIISCVQYVPNTQLATQDIKLHYFV